MKRSGFGRSLGLAITIALATCCFCAPQQAAPKFVGYVFEFQGKWRIGPQYASDLTLGQGIQVGQSVKLVSYPLDQPDAYIRIGLINKDVIGQVCQREGDKCSQLRNREVIAQGCQQGDKCRELQVDDVEPPNNWSDRFTKMWNLLTAPPEKTVIFAASRGLGKEPASPQDAVIPVKSGKPDLTAALEGLEPGKLEIVLEPVRGNTRIQLQVDWEGRQVSVSGPSVRSGLYVLSSNPDARPATVLIVAADRAQKLASDFDEARRFSTSWPPEMSHAYLSSVLAELESGK